MKIKYHCDDCCLTENISKIIFKATDTKKIKSVSFIVNTINFKKWLNKFEKKKIQCNLHINLIDGKPLTKNLTHIINKKKYFNNSYLKLIYYSFFSRKHPFKKEVEKEIENQIKIFISKKIDKKNISLDSHVHIHSIPWILNIILKLKKKYNITFIRSLSEPFVLSNYKLIFKKWFYINLIKFYLLRLLNINIIKKLKKYNIKTNQKFFGIIQTGNVNSEYISKIKKYYNINSQVLIHPGFADKKEHILFSNKNNAKYFLSQKRKNELKLIYN